MRNNTSNKNAKQTNRAEQVKVQKTILSVIIMLIISTVILLGNSIHAFAGSRDISIPVYKYYTSVHVENGDTLWELTEKYCDESQISQSEYMNEVCELNQIAENDTIHAGDYLVLAYYSTEKK